MWRRILRFTIPLLLLVAGAGLLAAGAAARLPEAAAPGPVGAPRLSLSSTVTLPPPPLNPAVVLYSQMDSPYRSGASSQIFEPAWAGYNDQAADDFVVPISTTWVIDQVEVAGSYSTSGHATSVNVYFYRDAGSLPVTPILTRTNILPSAGLDTGNFVIPLAPALVLPAGIYWVSVAANESLDPDGQWFWRDRTALSNNPAAWRNPGVAFSRPCTYAWYDRYTCGMNGIFDPDQLFRLSGTTNLTPSPTPSGTPPTATASATPPTPTPTPTGTLWPLPPPVLTQSSPPTAAPPSPVTTPIPPCGEQWYPVPSPDNQLSQTRLNGLAALSATDIWAVGSYVDLNYNPRVFTEHWDGATWSIVPVPGFASTDAVLYAVAGAAPNAVWAVGFYSLPGGRPLILYWDGTQWREVVPPPLTGNLLAVTAITTSDVWAVGGWSSGPNGPLTLHWDGTGWTTISNPGPSTGYLRGVSAFNSTDVWAVGAYEAGVGVHHTLVLHWNGTAWTQVSITLPGWTDELDGVVAVAPNDVWAVGTGNVNAPPEDIVYQAIMAHWNGTAWSVVTIPHPGFQAEGLYGLVAQSATDVWAVGFATAGTGYPAPLALHYDGAAWDPAPIAAYGTYPGYLDAVALAGPSQLWAAGAKIVRYGSFCAPPLPSNTPAPSPTATPPITPSPTATVCAITFIDVDQNNPFYPFVRCLACRNIVSGYADGSFRPNNNVTRGQLAKILSSAAGFTDAVPPTRQTFTDVPPSAPFWVWAERLAGRGAINGYTCGGPGEPCDAQNRPYYRTGNPATRGQIAKITALAARLTNPIPSTRQTFQDVPNSNPFWLWIEQLAGQGVISGYTCGGPGEPCLPPANRPYFRWGTNTTRGQMSKIAANSFFPACQTPAKR